MDIPSLQTPMITLAGDRILASNIIQPQKEAPHLANPA
jgi:hypothetical protein